MGVSIRPRGNNLKMPSQGIVGDITGLGKSSILSLSSVQSWLGLGSAAYAPASSFQPVDADLTAIAALTTTVFGRSLLTGADAAATRTSLGLGTLATQNGTFSGTSSGTNTGDQDLSAYVTLSGAQSLTNKKLGSLVANGFVKTSNSDGTLSVDTTTYLSAMTIAGSGTELQYRSSGTALAALTGSSVSGADLTLGGNLVVGSGSVRVGTSGFLQGGTNLVQVRNSTSAQCLEVANTYTSSTNNELLRFKANTTLYQIGAAVGSAGGTVRDLEIGSWNAAGAWTSTVAFANQTAYFRNEIRLDGGVYMKCIGDGNIRFANNDYTTFGRMMLGGTTSAFPSIKRNGMAINLRLADDSADAPFMAGAATFSGAVFVGASTVATLPSAAANDGATARVTDSSVAASGNYGATVAGGGANKVRVFSNGTNWVIA